MCYILGSEGGSEGDLKDSSGWVFVEGSPAGGGESFSNPCDKWYVCILLIPSSNIHSNNRQLSNRYSYRHKYIHLLVCVYTFY